MANEKKKSLWAEFKEFLMQGDVMTMAVGIIIGAAFTSIVNSLVDDIINPLISLIGGDALADATALAVKLPNGAILNYGNFIGAILNFVIIGLVLFCIVKAFNGAKAKAEAVKKAEEVEEEAAAPTEAELLTEIRDLLAKDAN